MTNVDRGGKLRELAKDFRYFTEPSKTQTQAIEAASGALPRGLREDRLEAALGGRTSVGIGLAFYNLIRSTGAFSSQVEAATSLAGLFDSIARTFDAPDRSPLDRARVESWLADYADIPTSLEQALAAEIGPIAADAGGSGRPMSAKIGPLELVHWPATQTTLLRTRDGDEIFERPIEELAVRELEALRLKFAGPSKHGDSSLLDALKLRTPPTPLRTVLERLETAIDAELATARKALAEGAPSGETLEALKGAVELPKATIDAVARSFNPS